MNLLKKISLGTALAGVACGFQVSVQMDAADALREHILQTRPAPLTNLTVAVSLNVKDFGALPDDGLDDRAAVAAAIASAGSVTGPVQINFEPGVYEFLPVAANFSASTANAVLSLVSKNNLIIDGHGARILIHRQDISFAAVGNSTNLIIRNFSVDYDPLPFSQGTVQSVNSADGNFLFELHPGFPAPDDSFFKSCDSWGMLKDAEHPGRLKPSCPDFFMYSDISPAGSNLFRIGLANTAQISNFKAGDVFVVNGRSASIGMYFNSENITFDHLTAYACPSSLFVGARTSRLNILNCTAKLKDNRLITAGADGVHCQSARVGPWVENCDFEGLSDDCLNIYSLPVYILEQNSPTQITVHAQAPINPGDKLSFFNPSLGQIVKETTVVSVSGNILMLNDPVEPLNLPPQGMPYDERGWKIYDHAYNLDATGNYFVYRNNTMHDGRRYGVFIKAGYGLIESNRFEGLSANALEIANAPDWPEGFYAHDLVIQKNRIAECGYSRSNPAAIIAGFKLNYGFIEFPFQKNIFLLNNVFSAVFGPALTLSGVSGLVAKDNEFISGSTTGPLITIQYSENILLSNNVGQDRITISSMDPKNVTVE